MKAEEEQKRNLGVTLVKSITDSNLLDVAANAADVALDTVLDQGLLRDIPVFGLFFKSYKAYASISDRIFLKKVALFLQGVGTISDDDKAKFQEQMNNDDDFRRKVGENLLLLLDRQDQFDKSSMLGKLFSHYIKGGLSYDEFLRLARCIDRASLKDLESLPDYYRNFESLDSQIVQDLYSSGLASIKPRILGQVPNNEPDVKFVSNGNGKRLLERV